MEQQFKSSNQKVMAQLVEPSKGRIVDIQITDGDDSAFEACMCYLEAYAQRMEVFGASYEVTNKGVRLTFQDNWMAESIRNQWRRKMREMKEQKI